MSSKNTSTSSGRKIIVGCCGFALNKKEYFKRFEAVEVQNTFYTIPAKMDVFKKWREEAPENFIFTLKAWQLITHDPSSPTYRKLGMKIPEEKHKNYGFFKNTPEVFMAWKRTEEVANVLDARVVVFQSPASFKPNQENIENMRRFFRKIKRKNFLCAWEPRGEWQEKSVKGLCDECGIIHCVDPFKQRTVSRGINYFRLHGKPGYNLRYRYTLEDFDALVRFCDKKENYVFFNVLSMAEDAAGFKKFLL
ncbi:MAG: DUF72 domain-containing protein [Candidatus Anstonellales archaeon]